MRYEPKDKPDWKQHDNKDIQFFLDNWFLALLLICIILGADAFAEWGAFAIEWFFTTIGVL